MRISQGIQNKILEALATGLRVVATPAVVNGMEGVSDLPVSVAADPGAMADAIVESLRAPLLSKSEVDRTRAVLATHYDWETNLSKFDLLFDRAVRVHP
jgi:glycosyltransferase involved in cell wall biosynthesis